MASRVTRAPVTLHLLRTVRGASARAGPIMTNLSLLSACRQVCRQAALGRRHLWWCRQRTWASRLDLQYQKTIDRRYKTLKHRYAHAVERRKLWDREFSQPHWRWHLARCWDSRGLASRWVSMDRFADQKDSEPSQKPSDSAESEEQPRFDETPSGDRRHQPTMEELKKELDENPYGVLFGHRAELLDQSGPWSPHGMWKSLSSKFGAFPYSGESMMSGDHHHRQRPSTATSQDDMSGSESWAQLTPSSSQDSTSRGFESVSPSVNEFEIDPITLRKVDRSTASSATGETFDIPVKKSSGQFVSRNDPKLDASSSKGTFSSAPPSPGSGNQAPKRSKSKGLSDASPRGESSLPQRPANPVAAQLENFNTLQGNQQESSDRATPPTWLAQEGFAATASDVARSAGPSETGISQSSIGRSQVFGTGKEDVLSPGQASTRASKKPDAEEDDLDQLRPSDVRASAGIVKRSAEHKTMTSRVAEAQPGHQPQTSRLAGNEGKAAERQKAKQLIKEVRQIYEDSYGTINTTHRQPMNPTAPAKPPSSDGAPSQQLEYMLNVGSLTPTAVDTRAVHAQDELAGTHPFTGDTDLLSLSKEPNADFQPSGLVVPTRTTDLEPSAPKPVTLHWQEQEKIINHDVEEIEDFLSDVEKQLDAVVRERRMRAATLAESVESKPDLGSTSQSSTVYKVLALDPLTQEISSAVMTSSMAQAAGTVEGITSLAEIIPKLHSPARFLAYIGPLQADGFELVSGGGDALVFKQVREPVSPSPSRASQAIVDLGDLDRRAANAYVNPIDGTTMGNFASPTGFVSYNTTFHPPEDEAPLSIPNSPSSHVKGASAPDKVTREEPVFSGRQKWQDEPEQTRDGKDAKKSRKVARRIIWGGAWVAACSYAVGVVTEFFRTGGSSGTGVQGF